MELFFAGLILNDQSHEVFILVAADKFSKFFTAELYSLASNDYVLHFVEDYMNNHGAPRNISIDKARSFPGTNVRNCCEKHKIILKEAPTKNRRATGLKIN